MKILIIGCSHSCGLNTYGSSKQDTYDHNRGWIPKLAELLPEHNIINKSSPGTGFNIHNDLLDEALLTDDYDLIICQLTSRRFVLPLTNYKLESIESRLSNLIQYTYNLKNAISIKFETDSPYEEPWLLNEENNLPSNENILKILPFIGTEYLNKSYDTFLTKLYTLQKSNKLAIINWGGTSNKILEKNKIDTNSCYEMIIEYIQTKYNMKDKKQARHAYNKITEPHMQHFNEEFQHYVLFNFILNHPLISNI